MSAQLPINVPTKLIVLMAFDRDEDGILQAAFEPREMQDENRAVQAAKDMAGRHAGVITWSRPARPDIGEYGEPLELYRAGDIPDLD
jgi:hypothetical protein